MFGIPVVGLLQLTDAGSYQKYYKSDIWCTHVHKTSRFEAERVFYMRVTIIVGVLLEETPQPTGLLSPRTSVWSQAWRIVNTDQMIRPTVSLPGCLLWPCLHFIVL